MLIGHIPLPETQHLPLNREIKLDISTLLRSFYFSTPHDVEPKVVLGNNLKIIPENLVKTYHYNERSGVVLEAVFCKADSVYRLLYVKINRQSYSTLAICRTAIDYFCETTPVSIEQIFEKFHWIKNHTFSRFISSHVSREIIRPIFSNNQTNDLISDLVDVLSECSSQSILYNDCRIILENESFLFDAMLNGFSERNPITFPGHGRCMIDLDSGKWTSTSTYLYEMAVKYKTSVLNHGFFDHVLYELFTLRATDISLRVQTKDVWSGQAAENCVGHIVDRFAPLLSSTQDLRESVLGYLFGIVKDTCERYCQFFNYDYDTFMRGSDESTIVVSKNIWDEVSISIVDRARESIVILYTYFPYTALTTRGAGRIV